MNRRLISSRPRQELPIYRCPDDGEAWFHWSHKLRSELRLRRPTVWLQRRFSVGQPGSLRSRHITTKQWILGPSLLNSLSMITLERRCAIGVILAIVAGCGRAAPHAPRSRSAAKVPPIEPAAPAVSGGAISIRQDEGRESLGAVAIRPRERFNFSGSYRVPEGANADAVYFQIGKRTSEGMIVADSGTMQPKQEGALVSFEGSLRAPNEPGRYELGAWAAEVLIGVEPVDVTAN